MTSIPTALLWYRRDLRVHDHPALARALAEFERVVAVFVLDDALLHGRFASGSRTRFMLGCLRALDDALRERGSALVLRHGTPERELPALAQHVGAGAVFWTSDVTPFARARDGRVTEALRAAGVAARPTTGAYCVDVSLPHTKAGRPFTVFTPFWKAWEQLERRGPAPTPRALAPLPDGLDAGRLPTADELGVEGGVVDLAVIAGEPAARDALALWLHDGVDRYGDRHDAMGRPSTSVLSPHLRWGTISAGECERRARERGGAGAAAWVRQLCWREFYAHVLLTHPHNVRHEHQQRYRDGRLQWDDDPELLGAWQAGATGYPIVDAGMRELAATGWMHNRARLIVGSFLTKDLHLDWRAGEAWFERLLLDGEPAQNNGNWQWIASVGVDPAPAFRRIYNPALQQARHDPTGAYVRRWVPELGEVPDERLAQPWEMTQAQQREASCVIERDYPAPIVDHAEERRHALERYRAAGAG